MFPHSFHRPFQGFSAPALLEHHYPDMSTEISREFALGLVNASAKFHSEHTKAMSEIQRRSNPFRAKAMPICNLRSVVLEPRVTTSNKTLLSVNIRSGMRFPIISVVYSGSRAELTGTNG
jgi:hypothetical protein